MNESTRAQRLGEAVRVGVDLAKRVIQVHAVDRGGRVVARRSVPRDGFMAWCAGLPPGCMIVMEVSSSAHHWARKLIALGLDARIVSAHLAAPYRAEGVTGKNDANDAARVCEAAGRPQMRFVPVKSVEQQSMLTVHRLREGVKADRTACINRIRGLQLEFGVAIASGVRDLELTLDDVLEDASNEMNHLARVTLQRAQAQWRELDAHLAWCDERIAAHGLGNDDVKRAGELMGVGPVGASAAIATVGDSSSSRAARSSAPGWGWCPGSIRRAGRPTWARFPKRGDTYLRTLLIQGAKSVVNTAHTRTDPISRWAFALKTRSVWQKAVVALANKNARILWGIMTKGTRFERNHKSEKPGPVAASASPPLTCAQVAPAG